MNPFAIRLVEVLDPTSIRLVEPWQGDWLVSYNPDARDGIGEAIFSVDVDEALHFESFDAAQACWNQRSTVRPTVWSADGDDWVERENRPLTVCSIVISELTAEVLVDAAIAMMDRI